MMPGGGAEKLASFGADYNDVDPYDAYRWAKRIRPGTRLEPSASPRDLRSLPSPLRSLPSPLRSLVASSPPVAGTVAAYCAVCGLQSPTPPPSSAPLGGQPAARAALAESAWRSAKRPAHPPPASSGAGGSARADDRTAVAKQRRLPASFGRGR